MWPRIPIGLVLLIHQKQKLVKMKMFVFPLIVVLYSLWTVGFLFFFKLDPQILNKIFWIKGTCWARRGVSLRGSSLWEAWCCSHTGCSSSWSRCCQGYWGQSPLSLWELCWDTKTCCSDAKMLNWRKRSHTYIQYVFYIWEFMLENKGHEAKLSLNA